MVYVTELAYELLEMNSFEILQCLKLISPYLLFNLPIVQLVGSCQMRPSL